MIIRRRHTANFTTIGNALFEDERLAADEVGILAYLLSRPHDWEVRRAALSRRWGMGREAIKRVISNLVRYGWCFACRTRLPNGTWFMIYEIRDEPGATLTDDEVRRALSLVSSEASPDEIDGNSGSDIDPDALRETGDPPTGYPSLAEPSPGDPHVAYKDIQNNDLPREDSYQKAEREHARAKEKHALHLAEFKRRWPTIASDDQTRVDNAWFALQPEEGEAALAGIAAFLERLKRDKRSTVPAGFTYLHQKRWALVEQKPDAPVVIAHAADSVEARALTVLHEIANRMTAFRMVWRRSDGSINFPKQVTTQLAALAQAPAPAEWPILNHNQAGAWEGLLKQFFEPGIVRAHMREGSRAPWAWPPSAEGKIYTTGPPETLMSEQDVEDFK